MGCLAFEPHQRCAALGAAGDKLYLFAQQYAAGIGVHTRYLGDDFTAFFNIDHVADVQVEAFDDVGIVERGAFYDGSRQLHGVQIGHWRDGTRTAHLVAHLVEPCQRAFGLELVGDGPAGRLGRVAQVLLLAQAVHLQHDAVGGHGQVLAFRVPIVDVVEHFLQGAGLLHVLRYLEAPLRRLLQAFVVAVGGQVFAQQVVEVGVELARGHYGGVLRFQCARSGVARIGKERFLASFAFAVQGFERLPRHQNLAAYLECRGIVAVQHERDGTDSFYIVRHVVTFLAVTAGHGAHQLAVFVGQGNGRAVVLQLATDFEVLVQGLLHPFVEVGHLTFGVGVAQREHGIFVGYLREVLVQVAAYTHGGRILIRIFGVLLLQVL